MGDPHPPVVVDPLWLLKRNIGDGQVTVNGEIETRRRRKMLSGDVIEFRGERLELKLV